MNVGWVDVTFANGVATGVWRHPDQTKLGALAETVTLDDVPPFVDAICTSHNNTNIGFPMWTATAAGIRGVSSHVADSSTWRVKAFVKIPANLYLGQR